MGDKIYKVTIEYTPPKNFFGNLYTYDQIYFSSDGDSKAYQKGEVAYDYLDNCQKLDPEKEKVITVEEISRDKMFVS